MKLFLCLILAISILSCTNQKLVNTSEAVNDKTYLALGDSYTIGEGVDPEQSFPYQLVSRLNESGVKTLKPEIVAVTGWTTRDLLRGIAEKKSAGNMTLFPCRSGLTINIQSYRQ